MSMISPLPLSPTRPRFLSEAECRDIARRLVRYASGGGDTTVTLVSRWIGYVRWARSRITMSGEDRDNHVRVLRNIRGAGARQGVEINDVSDTALVAAARRAERLTQMEQEWVDADVVSTPDSKARPYPEPVSDPHLFYESTYQLSAEQRAAAAREVIDASSRGGMLSAGYLEVSATSMAHIQSWGDAHYYQYTWAHTSLTVRDPQGKGSGWAGVDWPEWSKIDRHALAATALDKCLKSRNVEAVEPGRYTTILEPQAVGDFVGLLTGDFWGSDLGNLKREGNERAGPRNGFGKILGGEPLYSEPGKSDDTGKPIGVSQLGEKVIDERLTIGSDPMDPELGVPPFHNFLKADQVDIPVFHPVTWIENGVLKNLAYMRAYAVQYLGQSTGLPNQGNMRIRVSGPTLSTEEMIASTARGLYVSRFNDVEGPEGGSLICRGYTRDGLWLIENGKITRPVKNMVFVESILFALNNVEQLGVPVRIFHPLQGGSEFYLFCNPQPLIVPPMKIRDFSFVALSDSI